MTGRLVAQKERKSELKPDPILERLHHLGKTAKTQGWTQEECLEFVGLLEKRYIRKSPTWQPGAPKGAGKFRAGQNDIVMFLRDKVFELELSV